MSEYPWDIENTMLAQHEQPCDCAICDEIHFNRETRRQKRRTATDPDCLVKSVNAAWERATGANYPAHAEAIIKNLRLELESWKEAAALNKQKWDEWVRWHDAAAFDAKRGTENQVQYLQVHGQERFEAED